MLLAFSAFVLDYGVMWTARRQAQNAADAGALAGATARGYDDYDDPPDSGGIVPQIASNVAAANLIWNQPGTTVVTFDCPAGVTGRCVRVDVYRNGENGSSSLPTFRTVARRQLSGCRQRQLRCRPMATRRIV